MDAFAGRDSGAVVGSVPGLQVPPALTHSRTHSRTHTLTHSHTHTLTHLHTHTHAHSHTHTHTLTHSHTHTLTHSHTHTLTHTHTHTLTHHTRATRPQTGTKSPFAVLLCTVGTVGLDTEPTDIRRCRFNRSGTRWARAVRLRILK